VTYNFTAMRTLTILSLSTVLATSATAQSRSSSPWSFIDAIGYGGLGTAVMWPAVQDMSIDAGFTTMLFGAVGGVVTGAVIGHRASSRVNEGKPVTQGHQFAVALGTLAAGAVTGALASIPLIGNEASTTFLGSDETTLAATMGTGAALGAVYWALRRKQFTPPSTALIATRNGPGLALRLDFR
jgi:hypothetical protein